ncbi:MAG: cupredoxin family copper-binding protein [Actinobacteria bacterium]|nr:cupredoxin family copper-binding protein [Actinomycetota bacterium]
MYRTWFGILIIIVLLIAGYYLFNRYRSSYPVSTTAPGPAVTTQPTAIPESPSPTSTASPTLQNQSSKVDIKNMSFSPTSVMVKVGTMVTWTNNDSVTHTVTSNTKEFDSKALQPGESFSFTFKKAGTFPYYCSIHTFMNGTIIVKQ